MYGWTAARVTDKAQSLFDFGPMAGEYDRWYETAAGKAHDRQQKSEVPKLLPPVNAGDRLLDVGCGTGHWSRFFAQQGFAVIGADISPEMIAVARSHNTPNCRFELADACHLPFQDVFFDVVAAMATLEFVSDPRAALAEMFRCLKPGGSVLLGTLNRLAPVNRRRVAKGKRPYASARMFAPDELRDLLALFGRVRMRVTADRARSRQGRMCKDMPERLSFGRQCTGPFIVAEVRP